MIMIKLFFILCIPVLLISCEENAAVDGVLIKIRNNSPYVFQNVKVSTGGGIGDYGIVRPHRESGYEAFDFAYRYAFVSVTIAGKDFTIQPIDYVGEEKLEEGRYTYIIHVNENGDQNTRLSMDLRYD